MSTLELLKQMAGRGLFVVGAVSSIGASSAKIFFVTESGEGESTSIGILAYFPKGYNRWEIDVTERSLERMCG